MVIHPHLHAYTFYGAQSTTRTEYQVEADDTPADHRRRIDSPPPTPSGILSVTNVDSPGARHGTDKEEGHEAGLGIYSPAEEFVDSDSGDLTRSQQL